MAQAKGSRIGEAHCRGGGELVSLFHPRYLTLFYSPHRVLYLAVPPVPGPDRKPYAAVIKKTVTPFASILQAYYCCIEPSQRISMTKRGSGVSIDPEIPKGGAQTCRVPPTCASSSLRSIDDARQRPSQKNTCERP